MYLLIPVNDPCVANHTWHFHRYAYYFSCYSETVSSWWKSSTNFSMVFICRGALIALNAVWIQYWYLCFRYLLTAIAYPILTWPQFAVRRKKNIETKIQIKVFDVARLLNWLAVSVLHDMYCLQPLFMCDVKKKITYNSWRKWYFLSEPVF